MTRVLVVHHDHDMADIEVDGLRRAGYEVDQCAGPLGGDCPVLHGQPCWQVEAADVLVYDAWAAGTGASELIEDVRDLHPDKPVVLTTPGMMLNWAETAGIHRVTPVAWAPTTDDLVAAIEAALENARANPPVPRPAPKSAPQPAVRSGW